MKWTVLALLMGITVFSAACGPGTRGDDDNFGNGDGGNNGSNGSNGSNGGDGCSDASKLIYVVDNNNTMSQFDPTTKMFHDLGTLSCPGTGGDPNDPFNPDYQPFSMGVDRNANAYVLFVDQNGVDATPKLFKVDTTNNLACTTTAFTPGNLAEFGMGFSTDTAGGDTDKLFIAGGTSSVTLEKATLYTLDTSSGTVSSGIGQKMAGSPELTGNANAELWGFFPTDSTNHVKAHMDQINKADATSTPIDLSTTLPSGDPMAWAFAFYGGEYWVFLETSNDSATKVYEYSPTGALMSTTNTNTREIVGAGVSTCAPVVIE
ncbi:MAG: hypothetical protein QM831_37660 [Kofleriaceae bacterium]